MSDNEPYAEYDFDTTPRNDGGVKHRLDGKGDAWAAAHRSALGNKYYIQDLDAAFGHMAFGQNMGERLFLEYVPDTYQNRTKVLRRFAVVAFFDRKASTEAAFGPHSLVSRAFYLWLCRTLGARQPIAPQFFYVIGTNAPPWQMIGIDPATGERNGHDAILENVDWRAVWERLGLGQMRRDLDRWLGKPDAEGDANCAGGWAPSRSEPAPKTSEPPAPAPPQPAAPADPIVAAARQEEVRLGWDEQAHINAQEKRAVLLEEQREALGRADPRRVLAMCDALVARRKGRGS